MKIIVRTNKIIEQNEKQLSKIHELIVYVE